MRVHDSLAQFRKFAFTLIFALLVVGIGSASTTQAIPQEAHLDQFDMLTATSGWILLDQHLFWTSDGGQTWSEISPAIPSDALVQDVEFIDSNTGWVLWTTLAPDGSSLFQLAYTRDQGNTWAILFLPLFAPGELSSFAEKTEMGWFDSQTGWISVKQAGSSNFSLGTLFTTSDGGNSWNRSTLPVADRIEFDDPKIGWTVGGPADDQIFMTEDGGKTWRNVRPLDLNAQSLTTIYMPFHSSKQGLLVTTELGMDNSLNIYSFDNMSEKWLSLDHIELDVQPGMIALSILDAKNFVATIPKTKSVVRMKNGEISVFNAKDDLSTSIVDLDMFSLDVGWAKVVDANCNTSASLNDQTAVVACLATTLLVHTVDGGLTWQSIALPFVQSKVNSPGIFSIDQPSVISSLPSLENSQVFIGQGFDKCEVPTLSQMQTWSVTSPYKVVNLYVGGSSRACNNLALSSAYLHQLSQQGWKFIPTWVGPQAPCTGYPSRLSSDVGIAYDQGTAEANLAGEQLAELGLTSPDKSGSIIYYDMEYYGTNVSCRTAVNSFINGWVSQLHTRGNLAGVYGSTLCNTGLSDFLSIANVPDVIWPARWYHNLGLGYYDPTATVWNLGSCIPNTVWANHQRIRQYEGSHYESWGNLTLEIDSNVLDGVVAIPYGYPFVNIVTRANPSPTDFNSVDFTVTFSETVTGVNITDFVLTTTGVTSAFISAVSGSGDTYTVTVNTGSGNGTIRLDVVDDDSIKDVANSPLGGVGIGNGNFTSGEIYNISKTSILTGNAGVGGATLSYVDGSLKTVTANGSGNYTIMVPYGWNGTVTPSLASEVFCPASKSYANVTSSQTSQNYAHGLTCPSFDSMSQWTTDYSYNAQQWRVDYHPRLVADVNGDGKDDIVGFGFDRVLVALSNGTGFDPMAQWTTDYSYNAQGWRVQYHPRLLGDVNGDGKDDIVGFGYDRVLVALSTGTSFSPMTQWTTDFSYNAQGWRTEYHPRLLADVNGDGKADIVGFGNDRVLVALSTGSGFAPMTQWTTDFSYNAQGWRVNLHPRLVADVNGDGKADIVGFGNDRVLVALSTGSGFAPMTQWTTDFSYNAQGWRTEFHPRLLADVNGDGKADIVGFGYDRVLVALSTGSGFALMNQATTDFSYNAQQWRVEYHPRLLGDVNGDGKADIIGFGFDRVLVAIAK